MFVSMMLFDLYYYFSFFLLRMKVKVGFFEILSIILYTFFFNFINKFVIRS